MRVSKSTLEQQRKKDLGEYYKHLGLEHLELSRVNDKERKGRRKENL